MSEDYNWRTWLSISLFIILLMCSLICLYWQYTCDIKFANKKIPKKYKFGKRKK